MLINLTQNFATKVEGLRHIAQRLLPIVLLASSMIVPLQWSAAGGTPLATVRVTATQLKDQKIELTFATEAASGLVINAEGPWKLTVADSGSLKLDKVEFKREEWNQKNASFTATAAANPKKNTALKYKMIAFVCTKDKSQCFREVVEGSTTVTWKK
jgi:hypothetical protein